MTDEPKKLKVVMLRSSWGVKVGATRTLPVAQARELIAQGHAREA